jgi:hypothetical protein
MATNQQTELTRRFDRIERRLDASLAFAQLLADLAEEDEAARQTADDVVAALDRVREARRALSLYVGRKALDRARESDLECTELVQRLRARDEELAPSSLRAALRQRTERAPGELTNLLGFYLQLQHESRWPTDRSDKVDLLVTELSQRLNTGPGEPDAHSQLTRLLAEFYPTAQPQIAELERRAFERNLSAISAEVEEADSLSRLIESGTLKRYRNLKHRLGRMLLHPDLLASILETNHELQHKIRRLNSLTLTGIFSTYQGIFEVGLKGRIDAELRREIDQLHDDFDSFERRVKRDDVRLTELETFWTTLKGLMERLNAALAAEPAPEEPIHSAPAAVQAAAMPGEPKEDWLAEDLAALLDLLADSDRSGWPPELVSLPPEEGFQLDPREVVAYRRVKDETTTKEAKAPELFLLKAAALRRSIKVSARRMAGVTDAEVLRGLPAFATARQAVPLAESFLARYSRNVGQAILDGDAGEAQKLQILRMRLVREFAGIWLQVYLPM